MKYLVQIGNERKDGELTPVYVELDISERDAHDNQLGFQACLKKAKNMANGCHVIPMGELQAAA